MRKVIVFVSALLIALPSGAQSLVQDSSDTNDTVCADIPFSSSTAIPKNVLSLIVKTDAGKEGIEQTKDCIASHRCSTERNDPATLFRATEVHLGSQAEADLLVIGVFPMSGADNDWFWLVRSADKQPTVVLWTGGNCVQVLRSRTNGLNDVRSTWSSGAGSRTTTYRFDGRVYKQQKE